MRANAPRLGTFGGGLRFNESQHFYSCVSDTDKVPRRSAPFHHGPARASGGAGTRTVVDKSVVLRADGDGTRYLLLETIRKFGAEKLAADSAEQAELRGRHIARHLALADDLTAEDQLPRYRRLWTEQANLRAALDYALAAPGRQRDAARLPNALSVYWQMASSPGEGRFWLGWVLPLFWVRPASARWR